MIASNDATQSNIERFFLGKVVSTPGALEALTRAGESAEPLLARHKSGDWGALCTDDKIANEIAVDCGDRILSAYALSNGVRLWVITEADRSSTTILLPEEY